MSQIESIKEAWDSGKSISGIAEALGIDRKTVRKYLAKEDFNIGIPAEEKHASKLDPYKDEIRAMLDGQGSWYRKQRYTAKRIYEILSEKHEGAGISYQMVQRFIKEEKQERRRMSYADPGTMPLVWHEGEAQADFGEADFIVEGETRRLKYLNLSFPFSNKVFTVVMPGENCECVCEGLKMIFMYSGIIPRMIVFDNATGIGHRVFGSMKETELFVRFRLHYGFRARFANIESGWEKGNVENSVGYVRRNLMVPPMEFRGTFESFNADTMLPLSSSLRAGSQHYRKGDAVEELFAREKTAMRPFSTARQFDVVRYDTRSLSNTGSVVLDGSHSYCLGPNHAGERIIVGKRAFRMEFLTKDGDRIRIFERYYGAEHTAVYDMEAMLKGLRYKPNSWMNSPVRENMDAGGFRDLLDATEGNDRRRLLYMFSNGASEYGFPIASMALNILCRDGHVPTAEDMSACCSRLLSFPVNASENPTDVDLSVYDRLLAGRQKEGA